MGDHLLSPAGSPSHMRTTLQSIRGRGSSGSPIGVYGSSDGVLSPSSYSSGTWMFPIPNSPNQLRDSCLLHPDTLLPMASSESVSNKQDATSILCASSECLLDSFMRDSMSRDMHLDDRIKSEDAPARPETKMSSNSSVLVCSTAVTGGGEPAQEPSSVEAPCHTPFPTDSMPQTAETDQCIGVVWAMTQGGRAFSGVPETGQEQQGEMMLQILLQVELAHSHSFYCYYYHTVPGHMFCT